ncbi:hypothetical protein [Flavobacterium filum]|uniref:hypothetical protein n=1 Tax=Flavobacterium filum TaxID=370974 RepID=UPI00040E09A8|nr:hypothetical protein [Flavobacterium filum]
MSAFLEIAGSQLNGSAGQAATNAMNQGIAGITSFATNLFSSTLGAVFANGFDLSCWGASLTPADAKKELEDIFIPHLTVLNNKLSNASSKSDMQLSMNELLKYVFVCDEYFTNVKRKMASWSACSIKGINAQRDYFKGIITEINTLLESYISKGATTSQVQVAIPYTIPASSTKSGSAYPFAKNRQEKVTYPNVNLSNYNLQSQSQNFDGSNGSTVDTPDSETKKEGSSVPLLLGLGLLLAKLS